MLKEPKILVVGSLVMDLIVRTEKFPNSGETVLGLDFQTASGGKGANQAVAASRLGAKVSMVGKVGNDDFGRSMIESVKASGVDVSRIAINKSISSAIGNIILEVEEGKKSKNRIIVVSGANMTITPEDVEFLRQEISSYDMVMLQLEIPMEINELVADIAFCAGVPVMLNSAPSAPLSDTLLSKLSYISPNEHEAKDLTGITIGNDGKNANLDDVKNAAAVLLSKGVKNVIITLGSHGAALVNADGLLYSPCVDVVEVLDPTAAGDSFVGSFCTAVCAGLEHKHALDFANYTATLTVSRMGAQPSLPTLDEVVSLMKREGYKEFNVEKLCEVLS